MLAAALATLLGATLQSATGFGFALVVAPVLFVIREPAEALATVLVLGAMLNVLMLFGERRRTAVRRRDLEPLLLAAPAGVLAGVLILRALPKPALQVAVGIAVLAAAWAQVRAAAAPRERGGGSPGPGAGSGARLRSGAIGALAGALTTSTSTNGPPLVLWFQRLGSTPAELRDTVAAALLALNLLGAPAVLALGGEAVAPELGALALLVACTVAGHAAGRRVFERTHPERFRIAGLALVFVAGVASIVAGALGSPD